MNRFLRHIICILIPFLLGILILFVFPVNKKFSYQFVKGECNNIASWIYYRTFEDSNGIDVAFSGASHFACGIMDELIEDGLSKHSASKLHVANLGYCGSGRDVQYVMLKDLFKHKHPEILFIEVAEDESKKSHPVFPYLAETPDLFGSCVIFNQRYLMSIWKGLVVRLEFIRFKLIGKSYFTPDNESDFGYLNSQRIVTTEELNNNIDAWENRLARKKQSLLRNIEVNYSKHYLLKIISLAKKNNCKIEFIYLPEFGSHLKTPLLSDFYKEFGELITLPDSIINNQLNWRDAAHFNDSGATRTSEFILSILKDQLEKN